MPLIVVMMGLLEPGHTSIYLLRALGITQLVGRLLHGYAFSFTDHHKFGRFWATALTFLVLGVCAVLCVSQGIRLHGSDLNTVPDNLRPMAGRNQDLDTPGAARGQQRGRNL